LARLQRELRRNRAEEQRTDRLAILLQEERQAHRHLQAQHAKAAQESRRRVTELAEELEFQRNKADVLGATLKPQSTIKPVQTQPPPPPPSPSLLSPQLSSSIFTSISSVSSSVTKLASGMSSISSGVAAGFTLRGGSNGSDGGGVEGTTVVETLSIAAGRAPLCTSPLKELRYDHAQEQREYDHDHQQHHQQEAVHSLMDLSSPKSAELFDPADAKASNAPQGCNNSWVQTLASVSAVEGEPLATPANGMAAQQGIAVKQAGASVQACQKSGTTTSKKCMMSYKRSAQKEKMKIEETLL